MVLLRGAAFLQSSWLLGGLVSPPLFFFFYEMQLTFMMSLSFGICQPKEKYPGR